MSSKIDTVSGRSKLKVRREPYWNRISKGFYVGFRKMTESSIGTWLLRHRGEDGNEVETSLGSLDEYKGHERFDRAVEAARARLMPATTSKATEADRFCTLWDACTAYVQRIREIKNDKAAQDLDTRYRRWVLPDPIHTIELKKLTREHLNDFRRRMVATPVRINKAGATRERSKDTVNRDMASVRAALNHAYSDRMVESDFAWREPLKAFKNASKRRGLYLDREQRRHFINHAPDDLAAFLRGLSMLPLRPGALAALRVNDFDIRLKVLNIGKDKSGQDRRIKLPSATAQLFEIAARGRSAGDPLLSRANGHQWNKDSWKGPVKDAATRAGLPKSATAYTLRHSVISDLVHGGLDLLTVAQLSGTSVAMIEKHYGHLRGEIASEALAKLAL